MNIDDIKILKGMLVDFMANGHSWSGEEIMALRARLQAFHDEASKNQTIIDNAESSTKEEESLKKAVKTITRKFALLPETEKKQKAREKKEVYGQIKNAFVMHRELKNQYCKILTELVLAEGIKPFKKKGKTAIKKLFDNRGYKSIHALPFKKSFRLTSRLQRFAFADAFIVIRKWVKRNKNLEEITSQVAHLLVQDKNFALKFMGGKMFSHSSLKKYGFIELLETDCFGKRQKMSGFYINNHILQLRNLFFDTHDFPAERLTSSRDLNTPLQTQIKFRFNGLNNSEFFSSEEALEFFKLMAGAFTKKKKGKTVRVTPHELISYLLSLFFYNLKRISSKIAEVILSLENEIFDMEGRGKTKEELMQKKRFLDTKRNVLHALLGKEIQFTTIKEFKKARKPILDEQEKKLEERIKKWNIDHLNAFIKKAFTQELDSYTKSPNASVLKRLFKPSFSRISITSPTLGAFIEYVLTKLQYTCREHAKDLFKPILVFMSEGIQNIGENIFKVAPTPMLKTFSLQIYDLAQCLETGHEKAYSGTLDFKLKMIAPVPLHPKSKPRAIKFALHLNDDKKRIQELVNTGFEIKNPTITFNHRKLILHLPFQKGIHSKPSSQVVVRDKDTKMGVDSGLNHPQVLSVMRKLERTNEDDMPYIIQELEQNIEQYIEEASYFLGWNDIFNKKFVNGKIIYQDRIWMTDEKGNMMRDGKGNPIKANSRDKKGNLVHLADMKQKMVNLRNEIKTLQYIWDNYQNSMDKVYDAIRNHLSKRISTFLKEFETELHGKKMTTRMVETWMQETNKTLIDDIKALLAEKHVNYSLNKKELKAIETMIALLLKYPNQGEKLLTNFNATYRHKKKYNRIKTQISECWYKVNKIHQQLVQYLVHFNMAIANYHGVSEIFVENLKWATYKKKKDVGNYLSFWRTAWLYSAQQTALELQCNMNGMKLRRINPKGTSYTCPNCGHSMKTNRDKKKFKCKRCGYRVDSDLNSGRVISIGDIKNVMEHQIHVSNLLKHVPKTAAMKSS